jgi:hypothetical protein
MPWIQADLTSTSACPLSCQFLPWTNLGHRNSCHLQVAVEGEPASAKLHTTVVTQTHFPGGVLVVGDELDEATGARGEGLAGGGDDFEVDGGGSSL